MDKNLEGGSMIQIIIKYTENIHVVNTEISQWLKQHLEHEIKKIISNCPLYIDESNIEVNEG